MSGQSQHDRDSAELRKLCAERDTLTAELQRTSDYLHHEEARCRLMLVEVEDLRDELAKLKSVTANQFVRSYVGQNDQRAIDDLVAAGIRADAERIAGLEAELATLKAGAGEQKPYAYSYGRSNGDGTWSPVIDQGSMIKTGENKYEYGPPLNACLDRPVIPLFTTPQPAQDVSGLVSICTELVERHKRTGTVLTVDIESIEEALAKFEKGGGKV